MGFYLEDEELQYLLDNIHKLPDNFTVKPVRPPWRMGGSVGIKFPLLPLLIGISITVGTFICLSF